MMRLFLQSRSSMLVGWMLLVCLSAGAARADLAISLADSLPVPAGQVTGFCWAGGDTLALLVSVADGSQPGADPRVYLRVGDTNRGIYWQHDFSGTLARGLAYDGAFYWSCGDDREGGSLLYKINAETLEVVEAFPTPGHRPMALVFDGRWLWLTDRDQARIHRIEPQDGQLTRSVAAPGFSPAGLAWDGRAFWVTDAGTGRLTRLRGQRLELRDEVSAADWFLRGRDALLAHDGRNLWILPDGDRSLRRILLR
ncbi:MAG: hypothetical protein RBT60_01720 [Candidatus Krumholzibacteria bacterium]|nr:hypothetical protein [Candidatus Krumholzibacteria bacterium]